MVAFARDIGAAAGWGAACRAGLQSASFDRKVSRAGGPATEDAGASVSLRRVRRLLETEPVRWADIAYHCGYCDQSHLNGDFRDLAGTTPGDFIARQLRGGAEA